MESTFEFIAILSASLFTGASIYINLVEHPARMSCGTALAVTEFAPSYKRATIMQVLLALIAFLSALAAWVLEAGIYWLFGGILIVLVIPFTAIAILPTNKQLLDPSLDKNSEKAYRLLNHWGKLHAVRSVLSLSAVIIFLYSLIWE
ncbi:MAG: DUF1772 domain-containing protein [Bacteroidota bacterium]|nr:DUF1772 domain-containing protein [Bacteroidota bacterium]